MPLTYTTSKEGVKRTAQLLSEWQEGLRDLIQLAPDSIWADDAQYILSILYADNPQQQAVESEYLLKAYPNMQFEEWTKEKLTWMMPSVSPSLDIRVQLAICYKQLGDNEKLKQFCEESIKRFPERRAIFERFLRGIFGRRHIPNTLILGEILMALI